MGLKHLLVHVDSTDTVGERLDLAVKLAKRFGARLTGLFAESDALGPSIVGRRSPQQLEEAASKARAAFSAATAAGMDAEWWHLGSAGSAELAETTSAFCRYADLAIFGQHDPGRSRLPPDLLEAVVLDSGRPVLVVPFAGRHPDVGKRVVVGWNASREAARAVNDAIPLMREAQFVGILAFLRAPAPQRSLPVPPARIAAHLALHGIRAEYDRQFEVKDGIGPADALLNYASESGADLAVVGVPGQGFPLRHAGSTAREFLRSMTVPTLLSS